MAKLIIIDSANIMHKAIFAVIAQLHSALKAVAFEQGLDNFNVKEFDEAWYDLFKEVQYRAKTNQIFIMHPPLIYFKMIISYLKKLGVTLDDEVVIAEDFGSWRKTVDTEYKRQRQGMREATMPPEWWKERYNEFNEFLPALSPYLPWKFIKVFHCEADDVASVTIRYLDADDKILVSSDEDWQMLCSISNVKVFSPYSKKFKIVKNPEAILAKKIRGDVVDNLLTEPQTEAEFEKRKMIVDLLHLPSYVEEPIKEALFKTPKKNLYVNKIPYYSCRKAIAQLYA
jgi:hypothetical protein